MQHVPEDEALPAGSIWRRSAKALLVDSQERLLLLHMQDPVEAALGRWWELPGGGLEPGETPEEALVREVAEETGFMLHSASVSPARWFRRATFRWLGRRRWQEETVHVVRLAAGAVEGPHDRTDDESAAVLEQQWWSLDDIAASDAAFYPRRLAELGALVLAGREVHEPFERWS
jgi:8-oxo-dGTP pyrophosphatase MutT (NUDIX family)